MQKAKHTLSTRAMISASEETGAKVIVSFDSNHNRDRRLTRKSGGNTGKDEEGDGVHFL